MTDWTPGRWRSHDGLSLHYRDYGGEGPAVVCLPGLLRNARDFDGLAGHLSGRGMASAPRVASLANIPLSREAGNPIG